MVSLFTREWIEIERELVTISAGSTSPSLRGSGLKLFRRKCMQLLQLVSLFTREWIEIKNIAYELYNNAVSLFTREWIEIAVGSFAVKTGTGLPLYEGVD